MKWRLIEEYGADSFKEREDGKLVFCSDFSDRGNLFSWLLSMGDRGELVEPEEMREEFAAVTKRVYEIYHRS